NELAASKLDAVFVHTGYLINLAAPPSTKRDQSIKSLIQEIQLAGQLDLPFLVMHPGAHLGAGEKAGSKSVAAGLDEVFSATKTSAVRIALENTAGQGTCLGNQIKHLAAVYDRVNQPRRLRVGVDSGRFFGGGYDHGSLRG